MTYILQKIIAVVEECFRFLCLVIQFPKHEVLVGTRVVSRNSLMHALTYDKT